MKLQKHWKPAAFVAGMLILATPLMASSLTNNIVMPATQMSIQEAEVTPDSLKPDECGDGSTMNKLVTGSNPLVGSSDNDLILGSAVAESIEGSDGDDCIVSGDGSDVIDGGPGYDVCIGTSAASFSNCEERFPPA